MPSLFTIKTTQHGQTYHPHSRAALDQEVLSGRVSARCAAILEVLKDGPATDRQVLQKLHLLDMNCVRPRLTEMIQQGLLTECGETKCAVTGKMVRVVRI